MVTQNSLQPNHGFYGKSIHNSFISWLKNPSNLQTEVKKVFSQTFDNQEAVFTYTWIIQSTLHSQHSEHRCPVWWALEFWGGLASAHYWNQQPKKHQEGDKSPGRGKFPSLGCEKARSQLYSENLTATSSPQREHPCASVRALWHVATPPGLGSGQELFSHKFCRVTFGQEKSPFCQALRTAWMFVLCLSQQCPLLIRSCLLRFPLSLSPHYRSLSPQEQPPPGEARPSAPLPGNPLALHQPGQDRGGGFLAAAQPSSPRKIKM